MPRAGVDLVADGRKKSLAGTLGRALGQALAPAVGGQRPGRAQRFLQVLEQRRLGQNQVLDPALETAAAAAAPPASLPAALRAEQPAPQRLGLLAL